MYFYNERTKVIHVESCGFGKLIKHFGKHISIQDAMDDGYRFCENCSTVKHAFVRESDWITEFCKNKKIMYEYRDGILIVSSPYAIWRIVPSAKNGKMDLWHQNSAKYHFIKSFKHYHFQNFKAKTLRDIFEYIYKHDAYREENPVGLKKPDCPTTAKKGEKRYNKNYKRLKAYEEIRDRKNRIANVYFLLDQLEAKRA